MVDSIARIILEQLGSNKFIVMTGASHFVADGDTLRMNLAKNQSKANRLYISLEANDTYTMRFFRYCPGHLNKSLVWIDEKVTEIETIRGVYNDQLQAVFTSVTGMDTHL